VVSVGAVPFVAHFAPVKVAVREPVASWVRIDVERLAGPAAAS
jgi:hypothetical protein